MEKNNQKEKTYAKDEVLVMLEKIDSTVTLVAEKVTGLDEKMDRGFGEVNGRIGGLETRVDLLSVKVRGFETKFDKFAQETSANLKVTLEYLFRLDEEIKEIKDGLEKIEKGGVNKKDFSSWKEKVLRNEKEISSLRSIVNALIKNKKITVKI